ncbi:MAG TPA: ABC transporter permease [Vicinamibacterales bacterium]|nr:ABC transporter permease [Vicinamibacterales bacterium]
MDFRARVRAGLPDIDEDIVAELADHVAATYDSVRAIGGDADEALRRIDAQIALWASDVESLRRRPKRLPAVAPPQPSSSALTATRQDIRYAWRLIRRQPGYATVLVVTMALGIAATTVLGSVAYGVLLKPLPWANAPRLVRFYETRQGSTRRTPPVMTNLVYREWQPAATTLEAIGAWSTNQVAIAAQRPERVRATAITPSLLTMLEAVPEKGRLFVAGDEETSRSPVLLISHGFWQERYGGRPDIIGQTIRADAKTYTIIGVMPASFAFPDRTTRMWTALEVPPVIGPQGNFSLSMFQAIGRLKPGVTPEQAASEATALGRRGPPHDPVALAVFGSTGPVQVTAIPMRDALTNDVRPAILVLLVAVFLLLAAATANAASLQLARATGRRRELAIRAAIGAGQAQLVRQTLIENLLFGVLGGVAGIALAAVMHQALPAFLPANFPRITEIAFDAPILLFAIVVSICVGIACGLLPAWNAARASVVAGLAEDSLAPVGGGLRSRIARVRAGIMTGQVAIASILLIASVLLSRSFLQMLHADVGYDPTNVLTATVILPGGDFSPQRRAQVADDVVSRLLTVPGVTRAAFTSATPFGSVISLSSLPLRFHDGREQQIQTGVRFVSVGYFGALGQRVVEGREFEDADRGDTSTVVIVNREFARRFLDGRAMGWTIPDDDDRAIQRRVIGVVEDTVRQSVMDTPEPEIFLLPRKIGVDQVSLVVRTDGDPRSLVRSVRVAAQTSAPSAVVEGVMTMEDKAAATLSRPRLYAVLLTTFGAFALTIAGVGLFGVLSYSVALRAREIGVRAALGARASDIIALVLRQAMAIALTGIGVGLLASVWLTRALQGLLFGVTAHDATTFAAVAAVLLVVSALATVLPARRAATLDPVKVLRA